MYLKEHTRAKRRLESEEYVGLEKSLRTGKPVEHLGVYISISLRHLIADRSLLSCAQPTLIYCLDSQ